MAQNNIVIITQIIALIVGILNLIKLIYDFIKNKKQAPGVNVHTIGDHNNVHVDASQYSIDNSRQEYHLYGYPSAKQVTSQMSDSDMSWMLIIAILFFGFLFYKLWWIVSILMIISSAIMVWFTGLGKPVAYPFKKQGPFKTAVFIAFPVILISFSLIDFSLPGIGPVIEALQSAPFTFSLEAINNHMAGYSFGFWASIYARVSLACALIASSSFFICQLCALIHPYAKWAWLKKATNFYRFKWSVSIFFLIIPLFSLMLDFSSI